MARLKEQKMDWLSQTGTIMDVQPLGHIVTAAPMKSDWDELAQQGIVMDILYQDEGKPAGKWRARVSITYGERRTLVGKAEALSKAVAKKPAAAVVIGRMAEGMLQHAPPGRSQLTVSTVEGSLSESDSGYSSGEEYMAVNPAEGRTSKQKQLLLRRDLAMLAINAFGTPFQSDRESVRIRWPNRACGISGWDLQSSIPELSSGLTNTTTWIPWSRMARALTSKDK
jgi:hypothetical protein